MRTGGDAAGKRRKSGREAAGERRKAEGRYSNKGGSSGDPAGRCDMRRGRRLGSARADKICLVQQHRLAHQ